jgi:hypothetical protein
MKIFFLVEAARLSGRSRRSGLHCMREKRKFGSKLPAFANRRLSSLLLHTHPYCPFELLLLSFIKFPHHFLYYQVFITLRA